MKKKYVITLICAITAVISIAFKNSGNPDAYYASYHQYLDTFSNSQHRLLNCIEKSDLKVAKDVENIKCQINNTRTALKTMDFWFRYLEPVAYKKINGPLPVEWETEVFEKFEKPYKREGAGLTLAALYLEEKNIEKDTLLRLINTSIAAASTYYADSITSQLKSYHTFYLANRLFLLNLAAIYTTGFECPDTARIIPELYQMLQSASNIYQAYNESFPNTPLPSGYLSLYAKAITFVGSQPSTYTAFDHFTFIKDYVNPLFALNQQLIIQYKVSSRSFVDFTLSKTTNSIFNKKLYNGQNAKGIFLRVDDEQVLAEIDRVGKLLFYDPILSGNNERSCISCHKPTQYFTDTNGCASLQFNHKDFLARNSPSLLNSGYNHLIMLDGKHISLQNQAKAVIANPIEMGCSEAEVVKRVLSCNEYNKVFKYLLQYTPQEKEVTIEHIVSAITFYYNKFSQYYSPFDNAMNNKQSIDVTVRQGFNIFMSKAQCGTCHFVPQFNGVKPPYVSSEFEVLGVPGDVNFKTLSADSGRYGINPSGETMFAFRTGSIRNSAHTMPYMHNGIFKTLDEVIDFYDAGGGVGKGLKVSNQTLSSDSLHLTGVEKSQLLAFIKSLNENIVFENPPEKLPVSKNRTFNNRKVGGYY